MKTTAPINVSTSRSVRERRTILFLLGCALCLLLILTLFSVRAIDNQVWRSRLLVQSLELTGAIETLLSNLKDAETGQLGFLITREVEHLLPYDEALQTLPVQIRTVDALIAMRFEYQG